MWNDTEEPIAYLIGFRTYGTWLHGDSRGSVDRENNGYGDPLLMPDGIRRARCERRMRGDEVRLNGTQRKITRDAIKEVCATKGWNLHALNVRTNHVHAVVANHGVSPGRILNAFKAYATRRMRESGVWTEAYSPWSDKGSKRRIWNEEELYNAVDYVVDRQGPDLPDWV